MAIRRGAGALWLRQLNEAMAAKLTDAPSDGNQYARHNGQWQQVASSSGGLSEYMVPIWAEENSGLGSNAFEWAFGNGANTPFQAGISIYVPSGMECHIVAMSAVTNNASGSALIEAQVNNLYLGASDGVQVQMSGRSTVNSSFTDYALSSGDTVNFRTRTAGTNSSPSTVTAWLRYRST